MLAYTVNNGSCIATAKVGGASILDYTNDILRDFMEEMAQAIIAVTY